MIKRMLLVLLTAGMLWACQKEKVVLKEIEKQVEVEKQYAWKLSSKPSGGSSAYVNTHTTQDRLFALGHQGFLTTTGDTLAEGWFANVDFYPIISYNAPPEVKFPIADKFYAYSSYSNVLIKPTANFVSGTAASIYMPDIDSTFRSFYYLANTSAGLSMVINNANQLLIPYYAEGSNDPKLLLASIGVKPDNGLDYINVLTTKVIDLPRGTSTLFPRNFQSVGSDFYFTDDNLYKVNSQGELSIVLPNERVSSFVQVGNDLYAIGLNKLYKSVDTGGTWSKVTPLGNDLWIYNYTTIDGKIIAYRGMTSQLFEATFSSNGIALRELENDGISNEYFNSFSVFKGRVYVTTFTGMYYRDLKSFFDDKKK